MNLQSKRQEKGIEQADLAKRVGTNAPMMSNFEHYKCLPIPAMLKAICTELKCNIEDIYNQNEIYIISNKSSTNEKGLIRARLEPAVYKFSVRLPEEARKVFTQENLEKCGYHSLKDFAWHCWKRFEKQLSIVNKKCHLNAETRDDKRNSL